MDDIQSRFGRFESCSHLTTDGAPPMASRGPPVLMSRLRPAIRHAPDARLDVGTVTRIRSRVHNRWAFEVTIF